MRNVLVTGGGGFIGTAIVRKLAARGIHVTVVGRHEYPDVLEVGGRCLIGDIRNRDFLLRACRGHDTVFHVAAKAGIWGDRKDFFTVNVRGTENVIAACRANRIHQLVYTSTPSVVFDGSDIAGKDETLPYSSRPLCAYAETKIMAEKLVLGSNSAELRTTAIRPHLVWGPGDTQIIPRLVQRGREGKLRIVGSGENRVDITYIENVGRAHLLAAENLAGSGSASGRAFFISQGEPVVLWEWINALFSRIDLQPMQRRISFTTAYRAGWVLECLYRLLRLRQEPQMTRFLAEQLAMSHWFSIDAARKVLGYSPLVSTSEGIDNLIRWLRTGSPQAEKNNLATDSAVSC